MDSIGDKSVIYSSTGVFNSLSERRELGGKWPQRAREVLEECVGEKSANVIFQMAQSSFGPDFTLEQLHEVLKKIFGDTAARTIWTRIFRAIE